MVKGLADTTIRDFGGGWNVSDSDLNLSSRYQPISDNVIRGVDGSMSVRQGMSLWCDYEDGVATDLGNETPDAATLLDNGKITFTWNAHGFASGDHITISGAAALHGIPADAINGTHGIVVVDANTFFITVHEPATSVATTAVSWFFVHDTHKLGGNIIHDHYFNRKLIVFTDIGEIGAVDDAGVTERLWGAKEAAALVGSPAPTRRCRHWSSATFKSTVVACNGKDRDKPIQIDEDFGVEFLVDKASGSNAFVPKADYVVSLQGYVVFVSTEYGDPYIELSAKGTDGTFTRDPAPADSVEVDLSMITTSVEPRLLGAAQIRDKLFVAFYDKGMVGTLGVYAGNLHDPDFSDTIAEHGTVSHRTMVSLGNDIFMCDYAGVPSVSVSQQSGVYVPVRLSELISPAIQAHLSALSEDTLRYKSFAVYNRNDRSYMLFLPIYDEVTKALSVDPLMFNEDLRALNLAVVRSPAHGLFEDSCITVAGANSIGDLDAADINGIRSVRSVIDEDTFVIQLGGTLSSNNVTSGGGSNITITPINDETIGYAFEYNKEFKIRRWTRYRGWDFDCGCSSQRGKLFFGKGKKIYRMGDNEVHLHADFIGDYDNRSWFNGTLYTVGTRVRDTDAKVWKCLVEHTSPALGTFAAHRADNLDLWEEYVGEPINWAVETPWSDMRERGRNKIGKYINMDTEGFDSFTLSVFTNKIRNSPTTNELNPVRSIVLTAGDAGGWGMQNSAGFGGGRRTREEKVWPMGFRGKLVRWRYSGSTVKKVRIISHTMYYKLGNIR